MRSATPPDRYLSAKRPALTQRTPPLLFCGWAAWGCCWLQTAGGGLAKGNPGPETLEAHQLALHRIHIFKLSNDPKFAENLKDLSASTSIRPTRRPRL
jgi:hypothetical protein